MPKAYLFWYRVYRYGNDLDYKNKDLVKKLSRGCF